MHDSSDFLRILFESGCSAEIPQIPIKFAKDFDFLNTDRSECYLATNELILKHHVAQNSAYTMIKGIMKCTSFLAIELVLVRTFAMPKM